MRLNPYIVRTALALVTHAGGSVRDEDGNETESEIGSQDIENISGPENGATNGDQDTEQSLQQIYESFDILNLDLSDYIIIMSNLKL